MKKTAVLLLASIALVSCRKDLEISNQINVRVSTHDTRGVVTTGSELIKSGQFVLDAYIGEEFVDATVEPAVNYESAHWINSSTSLPNGNVRLNADTWNIDGSPKWVEGATTRFWARHPVTIPYGGVLAVTGPVDADGDESYASDELAFTYATPAADGETDADRSTDVLFAYTKQNYNGENNTIDITFHHALAQVRFCVSTNDGTFDSNLKIKNITITNLHNYGQCSFTDSGNAEVNESYGTGNGFEQFDWTNQGGTASFGQDYNTAFTALSPTGWKAGTYTTAGSTTYNLYTCQNVFFMIPQTVTNVNMLDITFEADGEEFSVQKPIATATGDVWLADHYYTYKIKATMVGRDVDMSVSLLSWSDRDDKIFI